MSHLVKKILFIFLLFGCALPLFAAPDNLGPTASGFLSEGDFGPEDNDFVDPNVLRDFIESKGLIECRKKSGLLTIAGDVRARWISAGEQVNGFKKRGQGTPVGINRYKSEVNLFFDYVAPRSWVSTKLKWVNFDGKDGGTATRVEMDRAFIGYDIYKEGKEDFYIEIGRSKLNFIYDSQVEFCSTFDGIHLYYTRCWPRVGDFIIHGGPFIIDSFTNHYAWIVETGVINFRGTGLGFKYSLVDWHRGARTLDYGNKKNAGKTLVGQNPRYSFIVSQMLFGYERKVDFMHCKTLYVYGAVLANHDAKRTPTTNGKKLNGAWYAGFTLGKLCKACDWSIDINYQSVQAQAVPEYDLCGIGHGNAENGLLSDAILEGFGPGRARGFTNYKGWAVSGLYAMTDNLSLRAQGQYTRPRNKSIGGDFRYKAFEMSVIYAF
ncbi:MAG: hypothetical protein S4CHLAM2_14000 [Chlamydiales bacterium]|nr:hypothetical protein [Chlamydiales bacterium]